MNINTVCLFGLFLVRVLTLTLLTFSCASHDLSGSWSVENPELVPIVEEAAESWCLSSNGSYCPAISSDGYWEVSTREELPEGVCGEYRFDPIGSSWTKQIVIKLGCRHMLANVIHELGHAAGFYGHLPLGAGVMSSVPSTDGITPADLKALEYGKTHDTDVRVYKLDELW